MSTTIYQLLVLLQLFLSAVEGSTGPVNEIENLIIDTDAVVDDARAITIALQSKKAKVLAITTVSGGVDSAQGVANVARLLRLNKADNIPIYKGACSNVTVWEEVFGKDGLGGVPDVFPPALPSDSQQHEKLPAADALVKLTHLNSNIIIVCIGPLTNIQTALKLDPSFASRPKKLVIMGGNYNAIGNAAASSTAEFNFFTDPDAAEQVLREMKVPIELITWESSFLNAPIYNKLVDFTSALKLKTSISRFMFNITQKARDYNEKMGQPYAFIDEIAVAAAIEPTSTTSIQLNAAVEVTGKYTRGQTVINWLETSYDDKQKAYVASKNVDSNGWLARSFVTGFDVKLINNLSINASSAY